MDKSSMRYLITVVGLVGFVAIASVAVADTVTFRKVDFYETEADGDQKKHDARLEIDRDAQMIRLVDEKRGAEKATYAVVPFDSITAITYENASNISKMRVLGFGVLGLFSKSKKHWLTIDTTAVDEGYVYMRLDKKNYMDIRRAVAGATGLPVAVVTE